MKNWITITLIIMLASCASNKKTTDNMNNDITEMPQEMMPQYISEGSAAQLPTIVIYKTNGDFSNNVPVTMDDSKTTITSYPDPVDVYTNGDLAKPTLLKNGYLLDNRGITDNSVFTSYTYEEYSKLEKAPSLAEIKQRIISLYPFSEFHFTRGRKVSTNDAVKHYNEVIDSGLEGWKRSKRVFTMPVEMP